jgi:prepilin-type N-terminal cleavage/methylation domain-containing protein
MTKQQMANAQRRLGQVLKGTSSQTKFSSGFTLIESLVAIVVISITLVAITPPIFWATGTRVQNRRAEQALALAQGEIDRVRAEVERSQSTAVTDLPASAGATSVFATYEGPAPTAAWSKMRSTNPSKNTAEGVTAAGEARFPATNQYIPVDTDGDGTADFLVQVFRDTGVCDNTPCGATDVPRIFNMTVRVYSAIAKGSTLAKLENRRASLTGTTGTKQAKDRPLAVLSSQVARSVNSKALEQYQSR